MLAQEKECRPQNKSTRRLIVIIPAYNEEATIAKVVAGIPEAFQNIDEVKVLVVNDGSTDNTAKAGEAAGALVLSFKRNRGLGVAMQMGIREALRLGADYLVNIDADGQFSSEDIPRLLDPILEGQSDMVLCSRFLNKENRRAIPWIKRFGNRIFAKLVNLFSSQEFTDVSCGFRAMTHEVAECLNLYGVFTYTHESLLVADRMGATIKEIDLRVKGSRPVGKPKISKNLLGYAFKTLLIIVRTIRDYSSLKFFGLLSLMAGTTGSLLLFIVGIHWLETGRTHPLKSFITLGITGLIVGVVLLVLALMADMISRDRRLLEEIRLELIRRRKDHE